MKSELLHGTLEVMILKALSWKPIHGYGIGRWIEQLSDGALQIEEGSLYPALYRLERQGLLDTGVGTEREESSGQVLRADGRGASRAACGHQAVVGVCAGGRSRAERTGAAGMMPPSNWCGRV
jgi:PadR family transcriptional regulator PadR